MRRVLRPLGWMLGTLLFLAAGTALLVLELAPRVSGQVPADAVAAADARELLAGVQAVVDDAASTPGGAAWRIGAEALNNALRASARVLPGLAAEAAIEPRGVALSASLPLEGTPFWLNLRTGLATSENGIALDAVAIGRLSLPPGLVEPLLRTGADLALGDGLGGRALDAVRAVRVDPEAVTVILALGDSDREQLGTRMRDLASSLAGAASRNRIYVHLWHFDRAASEGLVPRQGSIVPYLALTLEQAHRLGSRQEGGPTAAELRAALFALAMYCGDPAFGRVVGVTLRERMLGEGNGCAGTRLAGRKDLRQHFVVSAGLKAATSANAALGVGELKELLDSGPGGSGFSFDDMAANLAGARFAEAVLALPPEEWHAVASRLRNEAVVMPKIDGLPAGLPAAEFAARFGDVESPEYRAVLAEIERRVAALPLHGAPGTD